MAFRFSLAAVLRIREIHEQREERLLGEVLSRIGQARDALSRLERDIVEAAAQRETALRECLSAAALQSAYGMTAMLKEHKQSMLAQVAELEQLRAKQIKVYQAAHRDREVLSNMRREQHDRFVIAQAKREQKSLDDLFAARTVRK